MPLPDTAVDHYRQQQRLTLQVLAYAREVWGKRPPANFDAWFDRNIDQLMQIVVEGQMRAVKGADSYVGDTLAELGTPVSPDGVINPEAMVGVSSSGGSLEGLLLGGVVNASERVQDRGSSVAWEHGFNWLSVVLQTQLADISRSASQLAITAREGVGYVRMLNPPSCSRCAVQAGKYFRFNAGFKRHPGCDCRHIAAREDNNEDLRTDPDRYFNSLSKQDQNRIFTNSGAESIRLGANVGQVVNARSGMSTAQVNAAGYIPKGRLKTVNVYGQQLAITDEGVTRRGLAYEAMSKAGYAQRQTDVRPNGRRNFQAKAPRLMPESIIEIAEDRADALRLLTLYGYVQP